MDLNKIDLSVRLQLSGAKYSEILYKYVNALRYGKKDVALKKKLLLLDMYIELLLSHSTSDCDDTTFNCLTEEQAQTVCDKITKLTGLIFQPIGYNYIGTGRYDGMGSNEIGCDYTID
jgi:hypothetical protein